MTAWGTLGRAVIGSIGLLLAGYCGLFSLLVVGLASPIQPGEGGEGPGTLLVGLGGGAVALLLAAAATAMFVRGAVRWHLRSALMIAAALAMAAVYVGWSSTVEVAGERERLLLLASVLGALALLVVLVTGLNARRVASLRRE